VWGPESDGALVAHDFVTVALTLASIALLTRMLASLSPGQLAVLSGGRLGGRPCRDQGADFLGLPGTTQQQGRLSGRFRAAAPPVRQGRQSSIAPTPTQR
jgi:hypothetical protein